MISRLRRASALAALLVGAAFLTVACQKVPLLAPSGSTITLTASATALPVNGSTDIIAQVIEASGTPPHSGTLITFTTNLGTVQPSSAETDLSGRVVVKYVAGGGSGTATISALSGGVSASGTNAIKIAVGAAAVGGVSVSASPQTLPSTGGTSTISATVLDASGNTVSGVPVSFAIDTATGSSGAGSLSTTIVNSDSSGRAQTTLTTNRTTTVAATAGIATTSGTTTTAAQTGKVTVTVNTTSSITVGAPTPASPAVNQVVTFTLTGGSSTTASSISRDTVDWGDGQSQTYTGLPATISHSYRNAGSYLIVVTGVDGLGDTSTSTQAVTVVPRAQLVVSISSTTTNPTASSPTSFTISATPTSGNAITSVVVDFGDRTSQTFTGNTTSVQHVYAASGTYTVTAVANDSSGATGSASMGLVVGSTPIARFTYAKSGLTVQFDGSTSTGSSALTYSWNFGDNSTAGSGVTTSHTYLAGTYNVILTVTDAGSRTSTTSQQVVVP